MRPLEWLDAQAAVPGGILHLSIPEIGLDDDLIVAAIRACPEIESDNDSPLNPPRSRSGLTSTNVNTSRFELHHDQTRYERPHRYRPVVTGWMSHLAPGIVTLEINTSHTETPTSETIECTGNHPIWSADRQAFVPAAELLPGERLSGITGGTATLVRCTPVRGPPQLVYNLEVDGEHVYHVGTSGLLVHNNCPGDGPPPGGKPDYSEIPDPKDVTTNTDPTPRQNREMKRKNRERNGGELRDDVTGELMVDSQKSVRGVTPPDNEVQIDHKIPKSRGGTRSSSNLELRTRKNNRDKGNKLPPG